MKKLFALLMALVMIFGFLPQTPANAASAPPSTWQEHWFEHKELLKLAYYDDEVAVYFDDDINPNQANWIYSTAADVWRYTKQTYGPMGGDGRLYVVVHNKKYSGGHPGYYYNADHDYRNVIDIGGSDFSSRGGWNLDILVHEIAHIVEFAANGAKGSPAFRLWGDSKWAEIYQYDVYKALGYDSEAKRIYNSFISTSENFPRAGTYWFKNWFYPVYDNYGKNQALTRFFQLLAQYFPRNSAGYFTRDLNMGEYVHFMSGAAKADLKSLASGAFGWTNEYESQYQAARKEFPQISYGGDVTISEGAVFYGDANYGGFAVALGVGTYNYNEMIKAGIPNDKLSSVKVTPGIKVTLYEDANFGGGKVVITSDTAYLGDFNDKTSSLKVERIPAFYVDANYKGNSVSLEAGSYNVADLIAKGIPNDSISSVKVPSGYKVTLYEHKDFQGASKVLLADTSYVGDDFNDKTSSIKIERVN
ncbi:hypothetical protein EHV15_18345 [Paenibacillus oralis]|uniref:Beta/gamma crystallin 'Greek key' domain-containing protein n=2 Tax=Paenibacillus oralis TaxID=2490856 RepID=A0A3P3UBA9_9BACL|nr:hypothetical protein EHV15_18345 [Paenibacillus oralis]